MNERHDHRPTRCTAVCADGLPCRAWAVRGTDPPRCAPHGGGRAPVGAPRSNQNARTHGFYARREPPLEGWTIDAVIADLYSRHAGLSRYVDRLLADGDGDASEFARLLALHGKSASRLGRLLRDRQAQRQLSNLLRAKIALALHRRLVDRAPADEGLFPRKKVVGDRQKQYRPPPGGKLGRVLRAFRAGPPSAPQRKGVAQKTG